MRAPPFWEAGDGGDGGYIVRDNNPQQRRPGTYHPEPQLFRSESERSRRGPVVEERGMMWWWMDRLLTIEA
jgi:hypothetical protein